MLNNNLNKEIEKTVKKVITFWGDNVSDINTTIVNDFPFDAFEIRMKLYDTFEVLMEYERSTLGISVRIKDTYVILSKLANKNVFRGLKSYFDENIQHNFQVLDETLKDMNR